MLHCNIMTQVLTSARAPRRLSALAASPSSHIELASVFAAEWREIHRLNLGLAWRRAVNLAGGFQTLLSCRSREDVYAAQAAMLGEDLELVRDACEQAARIVADGAGEAVRTIKPSQAPS